MMMLTVSMVTHTHTHTQSGNPWLSRHHITLNSPGIIHITSLLLSKEFSSPEGLINADDSCVDETRKLPVLRPDLIHELPTMRGKPRCKRLNLEDLCDDESTTEEKDTRQTEEGEKPGESTG
ncbi:hypothetical protein ROHU_000607 [Labeo rohita]|uniref:Uncharacterized protein n=1 Tax=Labeo rohita TaxID=84645 RepID=A0A498P628_LABRO|nr:hypothetical protein ROHU_000607 [Labeo rohita]